MSEIMKQAEAYRKKIEDAAQYAPDEIAFDEPTLVVKWTKDWRGKHDDRVMDEGSFYRSHHDVTDSGKNTKPSETPSMWTKVPDPSEEYPLIPNPIRNTNPWTMNQKGRTADGRKWISKLDVNTWQPDEYPRGWEQQ